jgi:DNA-binding SARP family transcriptional activator
MPTPKVSNNFHNNLSRIRAAVGSEAAVVKDESGRYSVGVEHWSDVAAFEAQVEQARLMRPSEADALWQRAARLYRGEFLRGADRLWCLEKREALAGMAVECLVGLGMNCESRGDFEGAVQMYHSVLAQDEFREDVHRHIMRCWHQAGRPAEAKAQYEACRTIMRKELGIDVSAATRALMEEIVGGEESRV